MACSGCAARRQMLQSAVSNARAGQVRAAFNDVQRTATSARQSASASLSRLTANRRR